MLKLVLVIHEPLGNEERAEVESFQLLHATRPDFSQVAQAMEVCRFTLGRQFNPHSRAESRDEMNDAPLLGILNGLLCHILFLDQPSRGFSGVLMRIRD